ncbi:hypothetical protein BGZ98_003076 [Dissophora globulifera]|nr:hypothetical protein BGZ98_003076 [Dissophora globulifera]
MDSIRNAKLTEEVYGLTQIDMSAVIKRRQISARNQHHLRPHVQQENSNESSPHRGDLGSDSEVDDTTSILKDDTIISFVETDETGSSFQLSPQNEKM